MITKVDHDIVYLVFDDGIILKYCNTVHHIPKRILLSIQKEKIGFKRECSEYINHNFGIKLIREV